ncbi:GNAT family N-acetyltransferase [Rhizorhabdus dicambivorans]|uniref:N-acetyltransferase n=1 Tax=Rhizorhabdus dicambivorans TaxID=1850238 RepID=A0A2A4G064_9SPHN|nr:GNAT family N-acetyltransferase [Rhizorhabdus dicambivorans]ATE66666.1 N-acetyltransferase [Rhizorhabdus dicambivorans]PCE43848.1 N-acetyltransferase [Rhizorhabdus dicambivorans]
MFARTPRLLLRPGWMEDARALADAIGDFAVAGRLARVPWPYRLEDAEAFLAADPGPLPNFLIFARTHGAPRLVGGIGLEPHADGAELGYWIARPYWGLGFATEAGRAVVDLADRGLRLPRLVAGHFAENRASAHVLEKLGFEPTGTVSARSCAARGSLEPCVDYVRTAFAQGRTRFPAKAGYDREDAMAA